MRLTESLGQLGVVLLTEAPGTRRWGYELCKETGLRSSTIYPMLARMLEEGWLEDGWEATEELAGRKRPPRRYYVLTDFGRLNLAHVAASRRGSAHAVGCKDSRAQLHDRFGWAT